MIAEAAPTQANIIVDACESGGLAGDLGAILKHDVLGKGGSPSVTLVASAGSDQSALETTAGGVATQAILSRINGAEFVNNSAPNLDLVDIGRAISKPVASVSGQTPFVWGLNLFGAARFCKNPHYNASADSSLNQVGGSATGAQADAIRVALPKLYRLYEEANERFDPRALSNVIAPVVRADPNNAVGATLFVSRLQSALKERTQLSNDRFTAIRASAACVIPLLELPLADDQLRRFIAACSLNLAAEAHAVLDTVVAAAETDKFALLGSSGLADLYYLPLRLTQAVAWAGANYLIKQMLGEDVQDARELLRRTAEMVIRDYSTAFRGVSDLQAPHLLVALSAMRNAELGELAETLLSLIFSSVIACKGNIAKNDLTAEQALPYLRARADSNWAEHRDLISQPSELILVLLAMAERLSLNDVFDVELKELDHVALNAFVPNRWEDFGLEMIESGFNHTLVIGHHFFTVADVVARLDKVGIGRPIPEVGALALLASLIFPDRTPWYLWPTADDAIDAKRPHPLPARTLQ